MAGEARTVEPDRGGQLVLAHTWIPAERAAVCMDCGCIFRLQPACPRCASRAWMLFTTIAKKAH